MNKRIFALLMALAMVLTFAPYAPIAAEAAELPHPITEANAGSYYCSHCKENVAWTAFDGTAANGHYYLTGNVSRTSQLWIEHGVSMCLNLNGYTIDSTGRVFYLDYVDETETGNAGELSLMGAGSAISKMSTWDNGQVVYLRGAKNTAVEKPNATLNIYDEVALISQSTMAADDTSKYGGCLFAAAGSVINMHGGSLSVATTAHRVQHGGTVYLSGSEFNMTAGTINGHQARLNGGAIYMSDSEFNMSGGSILGGEAGLVNVTVPYGGAALYLAGASEFNMSAGTIQGTHANNGGSVFMAGTSQFNMVGGTINGATKTLTRGGVFYMMDSASLVMGKPDNSGSTTATINGITQAAGGATNGGAIQMAGTSSVTMYKGATIQNGYSKATSGTSTGGGNIHMSGTTTLTMNGGAIKDGVCAGAGKNIFASGGATLNLNGDSTVPNTSADMSIWLSGATTTVNLNTSGVIGQLFLNGADASAARIVVKKGFTGSAIVRYTVNADGSAYAEMGDNAGWLLPENITAEADYADTGKITANYMNDAGKTGSLTLLAYNGRFYTPAKLSFGVNHYDPQLKLPQTNTSTKYYLKTNFVSEEALWDYYANFDVEGVEVFIRVDPAATELTDITVPENGLRDGGVCINMSGIDAGITAPDTAVVEAWDSTRDVFTPYIYGGTVPAVTSTGTGVNFINLADEWGSVTSYRVYLNVNAYLRTASETIALQGSYEVDTAGAVEIDEIGMNLYDTNGTLVGSVKYTAEIDPFVAEALDDLKNGGLYDAAYVAIDSTGDKNTWWDDDVVAKAYMIVDGEVYEGGARTVNYKASVEKLYGNAEYHEVIADMIANTTHAGAYEGWNLVAPEAAA